MTYKDFAKSVMMGESRKRPGVTVGYIRIEDDGEEVYYTEWEYEDIEVDDDGEVTPAGWSMIEQQDEAHTRDLFIPARLKIARGTLSQAAIAAKLDIPLRTWENWESGSRTPPEYVVALIEMALTGTQKASE